MTDTERLDWCAEHQEEFLEFILFESKLITNLNQLRQIIDKAMQEEETK